MLSRIYFESEARLRGRSSENSPRDRILVSLPRKAIANARTIALGRAWID